MEKRKRCIASVKEENSDIRQNQSEGGNFLLFTIIWVGGTG